ncbi:MAG TPA: response regulator transcription factor [Anaerolineales bacterium]|jgi:two-component system KDP operon response regulator KdpE|nr:response regulator transcription factor [Anaerolineales bacterium]
MTHTDTPKRVLVIDDDPALLEVLSEHLKDAGYLVYLAESAAIGIRRLFESHPDLVVLDVMMPRMDGWEACARIREATDAPIVMLTAKGAPIDKLRGFRLGVDDYVTKPCDFAELLARIAAILRRIPRPPSVPEVYTSGDLTVDLTERRVLRASRAIELTPTEFRLLAVLAQNQGRSLSHEQLLEAVWNPALRDDPHGIKRYIWYLRQKIEPDPSNPQFILTDRGFGYRLSRD